MFPGHNNVQSPKGQTPGSWRGYTCGFCNREVSGAVVAAYPTDSSPAVAWLMCPTCNKGSVFNGGSGVAPGSVFGPVLQGLPVEAAAAYQEIRSCMSVNAHTAAELLCRKVLMYVAADKGAAEGLTFVAYLNHLESAGFITPPMKPWVDLIRQHGNQATHSLAAPDQKRAEGTVMFTAELLRLVYEMSSFAKLYGAEGT